MVVALDEAFQGLGVWEGFMGAPGWYDVAMDTVSGAYLGKVSDWRERQGDSGLLCILLTGRLGLYIDKMAIAYSYPAHLLHVRPLAHLTRGHGKSRVALFPAGLLEAVEPVSLDHSGRVDG